MVALLVSRRLLPNHGAAEKSVDDHSQMEQIGQWSEARLAALRPGR